MNIWKRIALAASALLMIAGCETVPVTGRSQLVLFNDSEINALSLQAYQEMKSTQPISNDPVLNRRMQSVGERIVAVSGQPNWDWEFTLFENDTPNASALPNGKVSVFTGLFSVARDDDQLAAVLGHEVAHSIARHGAEKISKGVLAQSVAQGTGNELYGQGFAILAHYGFALPNSRSAESEADHIGLILMAKADYDPRAAVQFWNNMEALGGNRPAEWLSTHPSPCNRIQQLEALMPQALEEYRPR
ncbi:MAG: M48 family metallopeptidase [Pseudomonadota bacterium]